MIQFKSKSISSLFHVALQLKNNRNQASSNRLVWSHMFCFCRSSPRKDKQQNAPKVAQVGFISNNQSVLDLSKLLFIPKKKLTFVDGKYLAYKNHRSYLQILLRSLPYLAVICGFSYLCYTNPFANTFPAAGPIFLILDILIICFFIRRIKRNQNLVKQIYLFQNGSVTQIHFANALKRKLFGEPLTKVYYNSIFVNPEKDLEQEQIQMQKGNIFPTQNTKNTQYSQKKSGYAWIKYFANGQNYLLIPKKAEHFDTQILIAIFEGKIIKTKEKQK